MNIENEEKYFVIMVCVKFNYPFHFLLFVGIFFSS